MSIAAAVHSWLRLLYNGCAVLGGVLFVAIAGFGLYQLGGAPLGYIPTSADEFAGYCMAASAFLALAYVFEANEHLRVTLVVQRLQGRARRAADRLAMALSSFLSGYLAWYLCKLALESWRLNETSQGIIPVPLWLPHGAMALGAMVFFIAVTERAALVWFAGQPVDPPAADEGSRAG